MSKIILELSDNDIQIKLDQLIGERVTKITNNYIDKKVATIIDIKLKRLNIDEIMATAARKIITDQYGEPKRFNGEYCKILRNVATELLTEQLKLTGVTS